MITVTLTAVATAIATTLWTKAQEKIGENIGDATWTLGGKLIGLLRQKNKSPLLTSAVEGNEPQATLAMRQRSLLWRNCCNHQMWISLPVGRRQLS
ncbi:hypothetical protein [Nostoc sp.]|uniref:hypothetical protein n=1 Tax=Nostoc sp. TaxID=1180 RepID=UPI002FF9D10F